jgi:hypothetical protein
VANKQNYLAWLQVSVLGIPPVVPTGIAVQGQIVKDVKGVK